MNCLVAASDTPALYAAGKLDPSEGRDFEDHLLECAECQGAVREAAGVRVALRGVRPSSRMRITAAGALAAAAVAVLAVAWPRDAVRSLGGVDAAPEFRGLAVRGDADAAAALADQGMEAYVDGEYAAAARLLAEAASDGDAPPAVSFFLGISLLMEGEAAAAAAALEEATFPEGNPYAPEARFYLAKARLRLGDGQGALADLAQVPPGSAVSTWAVALSDSVGWAMR
ncbi:MAG TPA: zf-HC2 domain-containing protein [Longimicrobiales bacterium]|nr:zf-HC2 domain-containing protein [Longimicrobiales bacterium]